MTTMPIKLPGPESEPIYTVDTLSFQGREQEISTVLNIVGNPFFFENPISQDTKPSRWGTHVEVTGSQGVGKTAFLNACHARLAEDISSGALPENTIVFDVIDAGELPVDSEGLHPDELALGPTYGLVKELLINLVGTPNIDYALDGDYLQRVNANFPEIMHWFSRVLQLNNVPIVVLIDNIDKLPVEEMNNMSSFLDGVMAYGGVVVSTSEERPPLFESSAVRTKKVGLSLAAPPIEQV